MVALGPGEKTWKIGDRVGAPWHGGHDGNRLRKNIYDVLADGGQTRDMSILQTRILPDVPERGNQRSHSGRRMLVFPKPSVDQNMYSSNIDAEYCHLRTEAVVRVPSDIDPAAYCPFLCAGVTVFNGICQMKITPGETVAIQGLGGLGHLAIQYAARMGYRAVALSSSGSKEKFSKDLGASDYVDGSKENQAEALQKMGGAALIVVTAPNPSTMGELLHGLAPQGKLLILARKSTTFTDASSNR